jgi:hypothetical protein
MKKRMKENTWFTPPMHNQFCMIKQSPTPPIGLMSGYGATAGNYGQYFLLFQSRAQLFPSLNPLDPSYTQVV